MSNTLLHDDDFQFDQLVDLSIIDLLILQYLRRFSGPTIRKSLLKNLNALFREENKKISSSSFYNRLDKLQKMGYVEVNDGRVTMAKEGNTIMQTAEHVFFMGSFDFYESSKKILPELAKDLSLKENVFTSTLIINLEEGIDINSLELVDNFSENTFILADDEMYESYLGRGLNPRIAQSEIIGGDTKKIREPEGIYDAVIITGFDCYKDEEMSLHWLKEGKRVVRKGGTIILSSISNFHEHKHFIMERLSNMIKQSPFFKTSGVEDFIRYLKDDLKLENTGAKDYDGLLFGWGIKPEGL